MSAKQNLRLGVSGYPLHEARARYETALADVYDPAYHFKSLQKAKVLTWERFQNDQRHLTSLIGQERDATLREALILCKEIEYIEYKELVECQDDQLFAAQAGDDQAWEKVFPNRWNGQSTPLRVRLQEICRLLNPSQDQARADGYGASAETDDFVIEEAAIPDDVRKAARLFGLIPWAGQAAIKKRFRELVKKYHPDTAQGISSSMFIEVKKAYEILSRQRK